MYRYCSLWIGLLQYAYRFGQVIVAWGEYFYKHLVFRSALALINDYLYKLIQYILIAMTHLQNKSQPYQQALHKNKHQYTSVRTRFRCQETNQVDEVFYSDEDMANAPPQKRGEIDDILSKTPGKAAKTQHREELRNKKGRFTSRKKNAKTKSSIKPIEPVEAHKETLAPQEQQIVPPILEAPQAKVKPNSPAAFQTCEENYLNKLEELKTKVDKKFTAEKGETIEQTLQKAKEENCFRCLGEYRAYFEKQTKMSYEDYYANCESAKKNAVFSKINQLIRLQKQSKHKLLDRLQKEKFRFRKQATIIQSIAQQSLAEGQLPNRKVINAARNNNLNESFGTINQFLSQNYSSIGKQVNEANLQGNNYHQAQLNEDGFPLDKKKKEKTKTTETNPLKQPYAQYPISQTNKNLQLQLNKMNDRKKILADIQIVNKKCEEKEKYERLQSQRLQRQRQKEKSKQSRKQPAPSNISSNQPQKYDIIEDNESEKKRQQAMRQQWYSYHKSNPKIKRLQILNRYHYNPFEENQGEDQCELWKKLMSIQIKNLKNDNLSIKNEEFNHMLIDELMREVENGKESDRYNRTPVNDIFILQTNYKPHQNSEKSKECEEIQREIKEKKAKVPKKHKKISKNKKNKETNQEKDSLGQGTASHQQNIEEFLDFGGNLVKKNEEEEMIGYVPLCPKINARVEAKEQPMVKAEPIYFQEQQNNHGSSGSFNYDQLPLQCEQEIVKRQSNQINNQNQTNSNYKYLLDPEYFDNMDNYNFQ